MKKDKLGKLGLFLGLNRKPFLFLKEHTDCVGWCLVLRHNHRLGHRIEFEINLTLFEPIHLVQFPFQNCILKKYLIQG